MDGNLDEGINRQVVITIERDLNFIKLMKNVHVQVAVHGGSNSPRFPDFHCLFLLLCIHSMGVRSLRQLLGNVLVNSVGKIASN